MQALHAGVPNSEDLLAYEGRDIERELRAISTCNQTMLRATDEQALLDEVCRIVCEEAGYRLAWVGYAEHDEASSVRVAGWAGHNDGYLDGLEVVWADVPNGQGPTGRSIRDGETVHITSFAADAAAAVWRERARQHGLACSIALPLKDAAGATFGALTIYSADVAAFVADEIRMLEELSGDLAFGITVLRDRRAREGANAALRESEDKFRVAFMTSPDAITITQVADGVYVDTNEGFTRALGWTRDEAVGHSSLELNIWAGPSDRQQLLDAVAGTGTVENLRVQLRHKDGRVCDCEVSTRLVTIAGEECMLSVTRDITAEVRAEAALRDSREQLRASEELFRTVYRTSPDAIILSRLADGVFIDVSDSFTSMLGFERDEVLGRSALDIPVWADPAERAALVHELRECGLVAKFEATMCKKDGGRVIGQMSARVLSIDGTECLMAVMRDATADKVAQQELHASRERLRAIIEHARVGIAQVSLDGAFMDANDCFSEIVGYSLAELRDMTFAEITYPQDATRDIDALQQLRRGEIGHYRTEKRYVAKDGHVVWAELASVVAHEANGDPAYMVTVISDVTERKAAEEALANKTRALHALSHVNESLIRASSEEELLNDVCEVIAAQGYPLVWVGYAMANDDRSIIPVTAAGVGTEYLSHLSKTALTWADTPEGRGPSGIAIREVRAVVRYAGDADAVFGEGCAAGLPQGLTTEIALPLVATDGVPFGAMCIYAQDAEAFDEDELALLAEMASDLSYGIESLRTRRTRERAEVDLVRSNQRLQAVLKEITETMGKIVETRDPYTQGHQRRVAVIAVQIAREMGLSAVELETIEAASLVHDVGKLSVPAEILNKPGKLSDPEFCIIKEHSRTGYEILRDIEFEWPVADIVLQHHERMDGSGYPNGLVGDEILMASRVLAVADVVEAIASHRPYRPALGLPTAIDELKRTPEKYDADVVAACVRLYERDAIEL